MFHFAFFITIFQFISLLKMNMCVLTEIGNDLLEFKKID
jgi:hypothetical protein